MLEPKTVILNICKILNELQEVWTTSLWPHINVQPSKTNRNSDSVEQVAVK